MSRLRPHDYGDRPRPRSGQQNAVAPNSRSEAATRPDEATCGDYQAVGVGDGADFVIDEAGEGVIYLNEHDPFAADWIRNLYPAATVDTRSITDVQAADVRDFRRAHFFAGVAGWELALELAGWPDDWPIWSGSCPCQPFSAAGKRQGVEDERHLWPEFFRLIRECRPAVVVGEQVASSEVVGTQLEAAFAAAVRRGDYAAANKCANQLVKTASLGSEPRWLDGIFADLEGIGYTCWSTDLPAAGVGAPHIRQRLFWCAVRDGGLANAGGERVRVQQPRQDVSAKERVQREDRERERLRPDTWADCSHNRLEHAPSDGRQQRRAEPVRGSVAGGCGAGGVGDAGGTGLQERRNSGRQSSDLQRQAAERAGPWSDCLLIPCLDGKTRRVGRGVQPLAHGIPRDLGRDEPELRRLAKRARANRVGRLRGYGNAIVPHVAAVFLRAVMEEIGSNL